MVVPDVGLLRLPLWVLQGVKLPKFDNSYQNNLFLFLSCASRVSTHSDLHCQQSLACVFGINGELDRQRGGHPSGVEAGSAGTNLTGIVGGEHLQLVGADRGREERLREHKQRLKRDKCQKMLIVQRICAFMRYLRGISSSAYNTLME